MREKAVSRKNYYSGLIVSRNESDYQGSSAKKRHPTSTEHRNVSHQRNRKDNQNRNRTRKLLLLRGCALACVSAALTSAVHASSPGDIPVDAWARAIIASAKQTGVQLEIAGQEMISTQEVIVKNQYKNARKFYWTAAGCAGIANGVTFVCKSEEVAANSEARYRFKGGTSQRHVEVKGIDGKEKSCHYKFDVNTTSSVDDMTVPFECAGIEPPKVAPPAPPPPPLVITLNISSERDKPTTVVVGYEYCNGTYQSLQHICKTVEVPAKGSTSISYYLSKRTLGKGGGIYQSEGGIISWKDETTASEPTPIRRATSLSIPATGNGVVLR